MHTELDEAVAAAYGWPKAVAHDADEIVRRPLGLNREIAAGTRRYDPFATQAWGDTRYLSLTDFQSRVPSAGQPDWAGPVAD
jgi:hypothetical protein